ncbi:MAG: hypothetical protein U0163_15440 [Gemmatimonadaceae bacterium]
MDDRVVLESGYDVVAPPAMPSQTGRYRLDIAGDAGQSLVSLSFDGERVADTQRPEATFAFVVPKSLLRGQEVARVRVASSADVGEAREPSAVRRPLVRDATDLPRATRAGAGLVRLSWVSDDIKGIMVRDARTGDVLTFARAGSTVIRTTATELDLLVSNGVRSQTVRVSVR